jgi:hypothetical protein
VLSLQESKGLSVDSIAQAINSVRAELVEAHVIRQLVETFEHAKTFGSLIQIPYALKTHLAVLPQVLALVKQSGDMYASAAADDLLPLVQQAQVLAMQFDAVVANPPYMGMKGMNPVLKDYARATFPDSSSDLFAMFIERGFAWCKPSSLNSMITMQSWMFLSSYEAMRENLLSNRTFSSMVQLGSRAFSEISGEVVQTTAFVIQRQYLSGYKPVFFRLTFGQEEQKQNALLKKEHRFEKTIQSDFKKIPSSPIAYWVSKKLSDIFVDGISIDDISPPRIGMMTTDNSRFVRYWFEIDYSHIGFGFDSVSESSRSTLKWFPYNKGGGYKKWAGLQSMVVNWFNEGQEISSTGMTSFRGKDFYFKSGITWGPVAAGDFSCRYSPKGSIFDIGGTSCFPKNEDVGLVSTILNSKVGTYILNILNPTMNFQSGDIRRVPIPSDLISIKNTLNEKHAKLVAITAKDWDASEFSWNFLRYDFISPKNSCDKLEKSWKQFSDESMQRFLDLRTLEENNNRLFITAYGLQDELTPEVPESQITLARADREKDSQRLISYAIGCMMGRYSLDEPGLIYAHAGNVGFEPGRYATFPADADGIVPITDELWFADDACSRIREFLRAVWGSDTLEENMAWLAESLGTKVSETPDETIRRYIADKFFKDHLQTYKKRPIYWLFSSGKQGAFQALVYLHRYFDGTLARLRAEYVVPLTGKIQSRIEMLQKDAATASSTAARNKLAKEVEKLKKKHVELLAYDEQLRHYADMRITLDLDDGVKANYGKFGDLLDSVKVVTGGAGED